MRRSAIQSQAPLRYAPAFALVGALAALVAGGVSAGALPGPDPAPDPEAPPLPRQGELNRIVLQIAESYPTDGTHRYHWPRGSSWAGTTRDLVYMGETIASGDPEGRCYCCGLTFEVLFRAFEAWCERERVPFRIAGLDAGGVHRLRHQWFGSDGDRTTLLHAVRENGIGAGVDDPEDARAGDFVQLWRRSGSGHSVVFLEWTRGRRGERTGIRYWSTQQATNGIGTREESFAGDSGVDPDQVYIARMGA